MVKKKITKIQKDRLYLPTGEVVLGRGTVPVSTASVAKTSIPEIIVAFRQASKAGTFSFE